MTTATDSVESAPAQRSDSPPEPMSSVPISLTPPPPPPDVNNEGEAVIEADPHAPNVDDGYASASDGGSAASTSISSSIRDYNFENRRRYHKFKEGRYFLPNDDIEQEREYMKHAMVMNLCEGRLHYAPLENPQKILDVGTGIGIWAIDMGDEYPNATVTGIDLSPIQPPWVPPNVQFYVEDAETDWVIEDGSLDYIHIRYMTAAIRDWPTFLARCYQALKPGGWIELQELKFTLQCDDNTLQDDNQAVEFLRVVSEGLAALNIDLLSMQHNLERVKDARFINAKERVLKAPVGGWPLDKTLRTVGLYNLAAWNDGLYGISIRPCTKGLGWSVADVELFLLGVRKSLHDSRQHVYTPFHIVTAQKSE